MTNRNRIFFRLADDPNNDSSLWTGAVTVDHKLSQSQARRAIAKHLRLERLPARTLVLTDHELEQGQWSEAEIRAETTLTADAPTVRRKKSVSIHDVPLSIDDVQDMLKKFGLA